MRRPFRDEATMEIPFSTYREKVLGCWLGKAVGGTLGGPAEGKDGPLSLTFYDPVPDRMLPNDDLDLQVVWLETIRRSGLPVERRTLADAWLTHVHLWPDEYGVACRNLATGVYPPASGAFDNGFTAGMGAAIRTEIWACLAPGDPSLAAALAREDACVDHDQEGVYAAVYLAALQSAAFTEGNREALLDLAAGLIPQGCRVARAIADTRRWWNETHDWRAVRARILEVHGRQNFTDVAQNLAFIVLGWLAGGSDFGAAICTAVNCGKDTDCTGATLGALLGILNPHGIGEEWTRPLGRELVLSPGMVGTHHPATLDEFTDQVAALAADVLAYYGSKTVLTAIPPLAEPRANLAPPRYPLSPVVALDADAQPTESLVATEPLVVSLVYPPSVALRPASPAYLHLRVTNPAPQPLEGRLHVRVPDGWSLAVGQFALSLPAGGTQTLTLRVTPPPASAVRPYRNPLDLRFEVAGFCWRVWAGLVLTTPWRQWEPGDTGDTCPEMPADAAAVEASGRSLPLPPGACAFATDVKLPYTHTLRYVVQAPRPVRVWLDGELVNAHDGRWQVPAIHRARESGKDVLRRRGWHRLTIALGPGPEGTLFVGVGDGESWALLHDAEWRMPQA
ncbi:MAG: ADP-ribosylglycohydrolase family protein [Armatimonadota bacterium]|nr:ADP-ribosylglycohydrolase family protein [Armatimonadota bacterium]